ncbi:alpha/beta-hydrolase [Peniophora sp. CONT]|nr:alpha/beta-hydrolase [Peniophora sp. CONT]
MQDERTPLLPEAESQPAPAGESNTRRPVWRRRAPRIVALLVSLAIAALALYALVWRSETSSSPDPRRADFYHNVHFVGNDICPSVWGNTSSHAGYIGLEGDSEDTPKRAFFWLFDARDDAADAPLIINVGGGPGSSGLASPMMSPASCVIGEDGFEPSVHHYTVRNNLVALDHPIGVGFSYGTHVSNSTKAAWDAYDFLQKLYVLYPHLAGNKVVLMGASYGGVFVPWMSEIIREQNRLIAEGDGVPGAVHVNLDSLVIGNPFTSPLAHAQWDLHYRCEVSHIYNSSTCAELYGVLPSCLESIELALQDPADMSSRVHAEEVCSSLAAGDTNHTMVENVKQKAKNELDCLPVYAKMNSTLNSAEIKEALGVPEHVSFLGYSPQVSEEFRGDTIYPHQKLLEPLISEGIRVLIHEGMLDANCNNLGVFSFLKLLRTPNQADFLAAADISWFYEGEKAGTFRTAGPLTYLTIDESGHSLVGDQPAYARWIVERWIEGEGFA